MILWHNPDCSKSRAAVEELTKRDIDFKIREYLKDIPTKDELTEVIKLLNISDAREMMRIKELEYTQLDLCNQEINNNNLIDAMIKCPKLIERPLAINNKMAAIGRPLENILKII